MKYSTLFEYLVCVCMKSFCLNLEDFSFRAPGVFKTDEPSQKGAEAAASLLARMH